jgi:peptide chain release factor 1
MKSFIRDQLDRASERAQQLHHALCDEHVTQDMPRYLALSKEHADLAPLTQRYQKYVQREKDLESAQTLAQDPATAADSDMAALVTLEVEQAQADLVALAGELERLLLPKDPDDERAAFVEIRAGTGGDESALFASDLLRMYTRYAERCAWRVEVVSESPSELGGYKEMVLRVIGQGVYGRLKFESGGHRVQRVPVTETQGRIHTSACTVAVLPEPDEQVAVQINPADLRIDTYRASGAGGQHVNKTDSAVRITHLPTGIVAECQDDRSQHRNKARALQVLQARIQEKERSERAAKDAALRKGLIGSGDRSDRIRTYNFPQGRLTDHRIPLTLYKLSFILDGDLDETLNALVQAHEAELIEQLQTASSAA